MGKEIDFWQIESRLRLFFGGFGYFGVAKRTD